MKQTLSSTYHMCKLGVIIDDVGKGHAKSSDSTKGTQTIYF